MSSDPSPASAPPPSEETYKSRWDLLYPPCPHLASQPRYRLCAPDLLELRWVVWDRHTATVVCFGRSPEEAVDTAVGIVRLREQAEAEKQGGAS